MKEEPIIKVVHPRPYKPTVLDQKGEGFKHQILVKGPMIDEVMKALGLSHLKTEEGDYLLSRNKAKEVMNYAKKISEGKAEATDHQKNNKTKPKRRRGR